MERRGSHEDSPITLRSLHAEADGNRTRQGRVSTLTGFEDRGPHQQPFASVPSLPAQTLEPRQCRAKLVPSRFPATILATIMR